MGRGVWYIIAVVAVIVIVGASAEVSVRSATCMACQQQEASFAQWMGNKLKVEKKGFSHELIACRRLPYEGRSSGNRSLENESVASHGDLLGSPNRPPQAGSVGLFTRTRIPSENCQYCHLGAIQRKAGFLKDLPPELQKMIGLAMDHRKHVLAKTTRASSVTSDTKTPQVRRTRQSRIRK